MIQYPQFYRKFVVRNTGQFKQPPLPKLSRFELPVLSMVHFVPESPTNLWPSDKWFMYQQNMKPIRIVHHIDLVSPIGGPKLVASDINSRMREFRNKNPRFRPALDLEAMKRETKSIVTHNYGLLLARWKYQRGLFSTLNRWTNVFNTMFSSIGEHVGSGYKQYIEVQMPERLPTRELLDKTERGWNPRNMASFTTYQSLMLHHLWVWLGENRHKGLIAKNFPKGYEGVHLVLREGERFCVYDMALIDSWRKASSAERKSHDEAKKENPSLVDLPRGMFAPTAMQKVFLRTCMAVLATRVEDVPEYLGDEEELINEAQDKAESENTAQVHDDAVAGSAGDASDKEVTEESAFAGYTDESKEIDEANLIAEIDNEIDALELAGDNGQGDSTAEDAFSSIDETDVFSEQHEEQNQESVESKALEIKFFPEEPHDAFRQVCLDAAKEGSVSALNMLDMGQQALELAAPLGAEGNLGSFIKIDPAVIKLDKDDPEVQIPVGDTVIDKTMAKSTLQVMKKRYIEKVFQKDVAGMIMQLQAAGIAVKSYNVEEKEDITGAYFVYTVQVKPVEGKSSTLTFKLPKVNEDGSFVINNVAYTLRSQRGDKPIRKIGPRKVALTSYYGKVFMERGVKKVNDYGRWLTNAIMARGLDLQDDVVTSVVPGNAFGPDMSAPRLYSSIAQRFRSFHLKIEGVEYACSWDATKATRLEKMGSMGGALVVGPAVEGDSQLLMDLEGNLIIQGSDGSFTPAPSLEEILELNVTKSPVEYAELSVLGKAIPVGIVLAYLLGFEQLVRYLKPTHMREVPTGKRIGLEGDEWSVVFDDKTYVFSRSDALVTGVLGGWREYSQITRLYPSEEFNKKAVYFNLFEESKLGTRPLRELDLQEQLFIDPITRELLREMNEPVVWTKLLIRAVELIITDAHPNEQDTKYMRIKGYERFAGAVYSEIVRSVRIHNSRPGKSRFGVELNPYAVWINVQQDPAKEQVSEINPIQNLKEQEAVTYSGTGGRNSRSMVKGTRVYHKNDMGVISESTVDSSDVAINVFTSANPQFNSLRGTSDKFNYEEAGATALLSTSALVSPGSTKDDRQYGSPQTGMFESMLFNC